MSDLAPRPQKRTRWKWLAGLVALAAIQLVSYQNCGSDFVVKDGLTAAESSASTCEDELQSQFESSYYTFLKTNCATCHTSAGPGQGAFADNNPATAFAGFLQVTSGLIDVNAVNSAHAGGYTGSQNQSAITLASQEWAAAVATCSASDGGTSTSGGIFTTSKLMSATATAKDISWNLDTELTASSGVTTGGATLTIAVAEIPSTNGAPVYYFTNPRLKGGTKSVSLSGLMIRINGQEQTLGSTWSRVSNTAAAGSSVVLSTAPLILEYDTYTSADTLSISIDSIK